MRLFRYLLPAVMVVCGYCATTFAEDCHQVNGVTPVLLREYINTKRTIPLEEKDSNIVIAGDVRTIWGHVTERQNGQRLRGGRDTGAVFCTSEEHPRCSPFPANDFDIIFDLYFDYSCDRSWGVAWLQFDNPCGIERSHKSCERDPHHTWGSGRCDGLCLKKAYWGYNFVTDGCQRFDVEVGRRPLYTIFDSYVQFRSRFDGVLLRYASALGPWATTFYVNFGGFIIDEKVNHYGYVGETGLMDIAELGFDLKYSYVNWVKHGLNRCKQRDPEGSQFQISQVTLYYNFDPNCFCFYKPVRVFGAYLWNHAARKRERTNNHKYNQAWYVGITAGDVCREGDWAAQVLYIVSQPQAVPDFDIYYIGRGNVLCNDFTEANDPLKARGNSNFVGWRIEFLYGFTDNLLLDAFVEFSQPYTTHIGGHHDYSRVQLEGIYAF